LLYAYRQKIKYKGLIWCSITDDAVSHILKTVDAKLISVLKHCEIAEEFIVQNILMESQFKDSVVEGSLRFSLWEGEDLTGPRILDIVFNVLN